MSVIAFDAETFLIEPGKLAPELVCFQWQESGGEPHLLHRDAPRTYPTVKEMLLSDHVLVGHNVAYDMGVIAAQWPDLMPAIFAKYDRDQVTDTLLREQLIMIARGQFRSYADHDGELHPVLYSLADCVRRHFSRSLKKEGFRLFYRLFDLVPDTGIWTSVASRFQADGARGVWPDWVREYLEAGLLKPADLAGVLAAAPEEAVDYALEDARTTLALKEDQDRCCDPSVLVDEYRQARAAFALHLSSSWGVYTNPDAVDVLETKLQADFDELKEELQSLFIVRFCPGKKDDGTVDTAAAREAMILACAEDDIPLAMTKGGTKPSKKTGEVSPPQVSLSSDACDRFDTDSTMGMFSAYLTLRKTLSNDIKMLRKGCDVPIQPKYGQTDTGRTRASKPNIQAINRGGLDKDGNPLPGTGVRECFEPREGTVFIQADFEGLELHTLAQYCFTAFGYSRLMDALNAGLDVHLVTAARLLGMSYEEALAGQKAGSKAIKEYRQRAKPVNFGVPGGLGAKKLARYAYVQYGVKMSEQEAAAAKNALLELYPEIKDHFRTASIATNNFEKTATETHIFSGRVRGGARYSALCNGRFQGLGADAAKHALWLVTRACYVEPASPLYGCRVVAFIHDEIIAEAPEERCDTAARELSRVMCLGANVFVPDCPVEAPPLVMRRWSKSAKAVHDENGRLIPWGEK